MSDEIIKRELAKMEYVPKFFQRKSDPLRIHPGETFTAKITLPPTKSVLKKCPACDQCVFMSPKDDDAKFICLHCDAVWTEKVDGDKLFVCISGVKNSKMKPEILGVEWSPL